uniref:dITP/XTP pyrophosphatase n=1 Tax=freshwater metagenome TaxID=449393 RepID=A0A6J5ZNU6_9ZZZZ
MRLTLATHNSHKLSEFERLLPGCELVALPQGSDPPVEDGSTFAANALIKARAGAATSSAATIADDSGICVAALDGAPGVLSARWAGEGCDDAANLERLIELTEPGDRLEYRCVIAYCDPESGLELTFEGSCEGSRAPEPRGDGGFGYDPAFEPDEFPGRTMAELSAAEKDSISHRGRAAEAFRSWLTSQ